MNIATQLAEELGVKQSQVESAISLLDAGATVPFIARYRKEATAGLDDTQLRNLQERLVYLRELEERRAVILQSVQEQGKLGAALKQQLLAADTKTRLEDLYAPYKPKRRSKAQIAREAGLEPLLDGLLADPTYVPEHSAVAYLNPAAGFADVAAVLDGARQIFMERVAEAADLVGVLRDHVWNHAILASVVVDGQEQNGVKFADYFDYREPLKQIPSHRALALFRGRAESVLRLKLTVPQQDGLEDSQRMGVCDARVADYYQLRQQGRAADPWLLESARWAWRVKVSLQIETEVLMRVRENAEAEAIRVFGENLRDLLLAAPAGTRATLGLDPGLRSGVKAVVLDHTGKLLDYATLYPHPPKHQWQESLAVLAKLVRQHAVELISIGNGTASRETDKLVKELLQRHPELRVHSLVVSEAGASVYSASELAAKEFPDLDVSIRGAVSIARRLQDPLAELVKIEPKAIGVGQYQHDVNQHRLARKLDAVVEDCVNAVGVEVNTASVPLLAKVAGLSDGLATNIVAFREQHGAFHSRQQLLQVPRLGAKAFEQAAGFLRIRNGGNPLDASAVHPEAYPAVERLLAAHHKRIEEVIGDRKFLSALAAQDFTDASVGEFTLRDILRELEKPGRDPRPEFKTATFQEGIESLNDLKPGMILEGVISNVTNFGAFVDIGVHQDGLVHISALSNTFVRDPREVVKAGAIVKVKVLEVDVARKRIGLSMRLSDEPGQPSAGTQPTSRPPHRATSAKPTPNNPTPRKNTATTGIKNSAMADAFAKLKR
ncbi:MAG: RNA-binding transcriptional accessory protein [Gammaproteobacteria bacterium]|nr:RNA-binding transcriptional accessory protein [Gammaproteobacteria bacterium]